MRSLICLAALACCLSVPRPASADPITISGGAINSVGLFDATSFTLIGDGFAAEGGREPGFVGPSASCFPCVEGDLVNFDSRFAGEFTLGFGSTTVDGVTYSNLWFAGVLAI